MRKLIVVLASITLTLGLILALGLAQALLG